MIYIIYFLMMIISLLIILIPVSIVGAIIKVVERVRANNKDTK